MIVLNDHKNYLSIQFEEFCKEKNIIIFCLLVYSLYFTQPLDISCFNILKRLYGKQFEVFIKTHINHIVKPEFFIVFKAAYLVIMTIENIKAGFRGASLLSYDL
jgi:hypothetical protein